MTLVADGVRCSVWAQAERLDPVGTAGSYEGYLLVEWPLPWPRDLGEIAEIAGLRHEADRRGWRVQGLVASGEERRIIRYRRPPGGDGAFAGFETDDAVGVRDVLLCTHGRRDVCCGSMGTQLALQLEAGVLPDDVRLWRTSHTGGHRFAPTFIVLPEATVWAFADVDLVRRVLQREGEVAEVADRYRGCSGLPSPRVQALEREVLRRLGWSLLDSPRRGFEDAGGTVRLEVGTGGDAAVWVGEVHEGRRMPVPDCGRPIEEAKKSETEWLVRSVRRLD